jgi:hypothetical protein
MTTYFVSGHLDLTKEEFAEHYEPKLLAALKEGASFVVGDAPGCDFMAQRFLLDSWQQSGRTRAELCTVYHMLEWPRHSYGSGYGSHDPNPCRGILLRHGGFPLRGGFTSDRERDEAMTQVSDDDIAWVRPSGSKRHSSGTAQNLQRRFVVVREKRIAARRALPRFYVNETELWPVYSVVEVEPGFDPKHTVPVPQQLVDAERRACAVWRECQAKIERYVRDEENEPTAVQHSSVPA